MTTPDFVQETLAFIDQNWSTANYDPKPRLLDRRDMSEYPDGPRGVEVELTENNAVGVANPDGTDREPEGLAWEFDRVEATVRIRVEAAQGGRNEWGGISDAEEFKTLCDEVERTFLVERKRPLPGYYRLEVRRVEPDPQAWGDYYRQDFAAAYVGLDELP